MKILMVAPLKRPITPTITASRPRIIFDLISGLLKKGYDITILGSGDTEVPGATIIPVVPRAFENEKPFENDFYAQTAMLTILTAKLRTIAHEYDVIHNHSYPEFIPLLAAQDIQTPIVTTIHGQPFPVFDEAFSLFERNTYLIAISEAHRKLFQQTKPFRVVHNGIDTEMYSFQKEKEDYLLWLGRMGRARNEDGSFVDAKGIKWAIQLARETGQRLLLSGNVEDMDFFKQDVEPFLNDKIQWIGPVSKENALKKEQVIELMQKARCFLMTINWYEPFGLVMAESMSCGTPVIGFDRGAVTEVIADRKTGFVVPHDQGIEGLKKALAKIDTIKPEDCRTHVVANFSTEMMINNYEKVYEDVIHERQ